MALLSLPLALAADPSPLMVLPFVAMLGAIALAPILIKHHWERHYHKISVGLGAIAVFYYLFVLKNWQRMAHVAHEYVSFIALIGSLFVVAGGIHIVVKGEAKPWVNCVYLLIGAVIANVIGTTGASMLLVRPWIRMNRYRFTGFHTVFFIFIVSNIGGCLTPIGDPPLFLGFLKGVPFWWVFQHCWQAWCVAVGGMLAIFYVKDRTNFLKAPRAIREAETSSETWRFEGLENLGFLALILGSVFIKEPAGLREVVMLGAAAGSYFTTKKQIHHANAFSFGPMKEVAWLFIGIFATMVPALDYLELHSDSLGIHTEMQFYWLTGALSGVLDNAPTYLTFLSSAFGLVHLNIDDAAHMQQFIARHDHYLVAISIGAVFFGAMTYIGNGPNLMVKSICEEAGVKTPSFFGYVAKYSLPVLVPFFAVIAYLFFSKARLF
jgi:Na+/H+ antiporter NhaD/arsenite permease-like protein